MSHKAVVLEKYPKSHVQPLPNGFAIMESSSPKARCLGEGRTAKIAWESAALKLKSV